MAYCTACGIDVQLTDQFCRSCGTRQRSSDLAVGEPSAPAAPSPVDLRAYDVLSGPGAGPGPRSRAPQVTAPTEVQEKRYACRVRWSMWAALAPAGLLLLLSVLDSGYAYLAMLWLVVVGGFLWFMAWVYDDRLPEPQRSRRIYTVGALTTVAAIGLHQHRQHHTQQVRERRAQDDLHVLAQATRGHRHHGHHGGRS